MDINIKSCVTNNIHRSRIPEVLYCQESGSHSGVGSFMCLRVGVESPHTQKQEPWLFTVYYVDVEISCMPP